MTPGFQNERYEYRVELKTPDGVKVLYRVARTIDEASDQAYSEFFPSSVQAISFTGRRFTNDTQT